MNETWTYIAKAITGAIIALLTGLATGLTQDGLSWYEVVVALIAFFVALGAVYQIPNGPKKAG